MDFRIRDLPPDIHRQLKAQAALAGVSLNEYMIEVLRKGANSGKKK
jgi:predicted HicB family RNase H-like nuclease